MARTRSDLVTKALDKLGVTIVGQAPSAEDSTKVDDEVDDLFDELSGLGVLYVNDPDAIEGKFFNSLAILLANRCANDFGASYDRAVDAAEHAKLRMLQPRPGGFDAQQVEYF